MRNPEFPFIMIFPASDKVNFKDYAFASYIITPDGNFQVFDFWPTSVRSIDDMLTYTNKTKDAAYTLYNLYVCDEDYSEASAAELAKAENDAAVLSQNTTAVTASQNNRVELFHTWMAGSTTGYVYIWVHGAGRSIYAVAENIPLCVGIEDAPWLHG